jgi:hypothetical protein
VHELISTLQFDLHPNNRFGIELISMALVAQASRPGFGRGGGGVLVLEDLPWSDALVGQQLLRCNV